MATDNTFNLSTAATEKYEIQKVPAVFAPLAAATLDAIPLQETVRALDVACGTGVIPKLLSKRLTKKSRVVGTDLNPAMVEVARSTMPESIHDLEWFSCDVTDLPFDADDFDIAFCQQGLQFFPDKAAALEEIRRVLAPGGRLVLTCWSMVSPLFQAVSDSLSRRVSEEAAKKAVAPFSFRDGAVIASLLVDAGFRVSKKSRLMVHRPLTPARHAIRQEILASPYETDLLDKGDATIDSVVADVDEALEQYREEESLIVPQEAHLFEAQKTTSM